MHFISDKLNWQLKSIFRAENIPIRFYHNNKSLNKSNNGERCNSQCLSK
jgi:hypothetical protein